MTRDEWLSRCTAHLIQRGLDGMWANAVALACIESYEEDSKGQSVVYEEPEAAADEELSCFDNDED